MNEKKCNGYESMYTFLNEEDFLKHLEVCEDCRKEHEKMQKISALIQEAKPYIVRKKKDRLKQLKVACVALGVFGVGLTYPMYTIGNVIAEIRAPSLALCKFKRSFKIHLGSLR